MFNSTKIINYFLLYLLIAFSGVPFFIFAKSTFLILLFPLPAVVYFYRKSELPKFIALYLIYVVLLLMLQTIKFKFFPVETYIGIILKVLFAFFVIELLKEKFIPYYVNIIYVSTIISLFFYILSYAPGFENIIASKLSPIMENPLLKQEGYKVWPNIIIYTANSGGAEPLLRNSGPFWEPGAFAGFLVIALIFNFIQTQDFWHKKNKLLMIGLLSTFSTTGILSLFVLIAGYFLSNRKVYVKIITIPLVLLLGFYAFNTIDILGKKISEKMDIENAEYNTRFKSAVLDIRDTIENPILGLGRNIETRFKGEKDPVKIHRNNGVTDFMASVGFLTFILYFYFMYFSFNKLCKVNGFKAEFANYAIILIIMIGFSEGYFFRPFFYSLTMLHIHIIKAKTEQILDKGKGQIPDSLIGAGIS